MAFEHHIGSAGHFPVEPPLAARWALLHRHLEDDGNPAVTLGELGSLDRSPVRLVTASAAHQRLLRQSVDQGWDRARLQ